MRRKSVVVVAVLLLAFLSGLPAYAITPIEKKIDWANGDEVMRLVEENQGIKSEDLRSLLSFPSASKTTDGPDITCTIDAPPIGCIGDNLPYDATVTVTNIGNMASGPFDVRANYWGRWYPDSADSNVGFRINIDGGLAPGQSFVWHITSFPFIPTCIQYAIVAWCDLHQEIAESNESNNIVIDEIRLTTCHTENCVTATKTPTATRTASETDEPTITCTPTITNTGAATATASLTPTNTSPPTATPSSTMTATGTATSSLTPTKTASATATDTTAPTATKTGTATATLSPVPTATPSKTASATATNTGLPTATNTSLPTASATATPTNTSVNTATPSSTASRTATSTLTPTASASPTITDTGAPTATKSGTATKTATPTNSPVNTWTPSATMTRTGTATSTLTPTETTMATATKTGTATKTVTSSPTRTASPTVTNTGDPTATVTATPSASATPGQPDVTVDIDLLTADLQPRPENDCLEDQGIRILAIHITNLGSATADHVVIKILAENDKGFFVHDKDIEIFANYFGKEYLVTTGPLGPGEERTIYLQNDPFTPGCETLYGAVVIVDPENTIAESNEDNNRVAKPFIAGCCPTATPTETASASPTTTATESATPTGSPTVSPTATERPNAADIIVKPMTGTIDLGQQNVQVCFYLHNLSPTYGVQDLVLDVTETYSETVMHLDVNQLFYPPLILPGSGEPIGINVGCMQFDSFTLPPDLQHRYHFEYSFTWVWRKPHDGIAGLGIGTDDFDELIRVPGTATPTATATASTSPSRTPTGSATATLTPTASQSPSPTRTATASRTASPTSTEMPTATATPTETPSGCDSGLYVLDIFGNVLRVGHPPLIQGSSYPMPVDFEKAWVPVDDSFEIDLAELDRDGVVALVAHPSSNITQDFFIPERAVDLEMSQASDGFWVLSDDGSIYRAGSALPVGEDPLLVGTSQLGTLGHEVPFGTMRDPNLPEPGGASLRAVALAVIAQVTQGNEAEGFIVIDSQGGHYQYHADGSLVLPGDYTSTDKNGKGLASNHPYRLLDPDGYVWPFFAGLDIARAMTPHMSQQGLVIFDGWGGIHPVPVNDLANPVYYTRNNDPHNPGQLITTVGMPYLVQGFDNPETGVDEGDPSLFGIDAESIYVDFKFSEGCPEGFYTLDKFGGIAAFGDTRADPESITPGFEGIYWFFPHLWGEKIEVFRP